MAIDHHARAVGELDLEHAALLQLDVGLHARRFQRGLDALERRVGALRELALIHKLTW
jgi:hypothetical protein